MIDSDPCRTARRNLKRRARFGAIPRACILCGYLDPVALILVTKSELESKGVPGSVFEKDHIVGRAHDPEFTFPVCRNCHAIITDERLRNGITMLPETDDNKRAVLRLGALGLFEEKTADALRRWAKETADSPTTKHDARNLEALAALHEKAAIDLHRWAQKRINSGGQHVW